MTDVELGRDPNMKHYGHRLGRVFVAATSIQTVTKLPKIPILSIKFIMDYNGFFDGLSWDIMDYHWHFQGGRGH